jgi:hypothetical protein
VGLVDSMAADLVPPAPKIGGWGRRWSPLAAASLLVPAATKQKKGCRVGGNGQPRFKMLPA